MLNPKTVFNLQNSCIKSSNPRFKKIKHKTPDIAANDEPAEERHVAVLFEVGPGHADLLQLFLAVDGGRFRAAGRYGSAA